MGLGWLEEDWSFGFGFSVGQDRTGASLRSSAGALEPE